MHAQHKQPLLDGNYTEDKQPGFIQRYASCLVGLLSLAVIGLIVAVVIVANKSSSSSSPNSSLISANLSSSILAMRDTSLDPCDDFYQYACNGWFKANPDLLNNVTDNYYYSFSTIGTLVMKQQLDIISGHFPFISSFYDECIDTATIDAAGITDSIQPLFDNIDQSGNLNQFYGLIGKYQANGLASTAFFNTMVQPDNLYADVYRVYLQPSGLSASFADYTDPAFMNYLIDQVSQTFVAAGFTAANAQTAANDVYQLEKYIFNLTQSLPNLADQGALIAATQRIPLSQLASAYTAYFQPLQSTQAFTDIDVVVPSFFNNLTAHLTALINTGSVRQIRNYIKFHVVLGSMTYLPSPFRTIAANLTSNGFPAYRFSSQSSSTSVLRSFDSYSAETAVFGVASPHARLLKDDARNDLCVQATIAQFADLVSHEWVMKDFSDEQKAQATTLVDAIYTTIGQRIKEVTWLDEPTRANAIDKWSKIVKNVGYSNDWLDYTTLKVTNTLFGDLQAISYFMSMANNGLYNQPVDRTQMPTRDYMIQNAFYNPSTNNINLLGGLIFPPFFDVTAPMMLNFAAYGMVIGHEITHGFDNSGRLFNGTGAYVNWWTDASAEAFTNRTQCLIDQYNGFYINGTDQHVNGAQTLGENIADHGGINTAFSAYKQFAQPANNAQLMSEITNDQLFFLYYAQNWCAETTTSFLLKRLVEDVHSPARFRVNGPLSNKKEFANAYNCKADSKMGRSLTNKQCELW